MTGEGQQVGWFRQVRSGRDALRASLQLLTRNRGWSMRIGLSLVDQVLLSSVNFAIGWAFVKVASKEQFAYYTLAFGVVLFLTGIQNALVTTPMTVLAAKMSGARRMSFVRDLWLTQSLTILLTGSLLLILLGILHSQSWVSGHFIWVWAACTVAVAGVLVREFGRAVWVMEMRPGIALALDSVFSGGLLLALLGLVVVRRLDAGWVLTAMGTAGLGTCVFEATWSRGWRAVRWSEVLLTFRQCWGLGRWSLAGAGVTWVQGQSYPYLLGLIAGASAVADLAASRLILMPVSLAVVSWNRLFIPKGSEWVQNGHYAKTRNVLYGSTAGLMLFLTGYMGLLWICYPWLQQGLLAGKYTGLGPFIVLWSIFFIVNVIRSTASSALLFLERFRELFWFSLWSAMLFMTLSVILISSYRTAGTILSLVSGEAILAVLCWKEVSVVLSRLIRSDSKTQPCDVGSTGSLLTGAPEQGT